MRSIDRHRTRVAQLLGTPFEGDLDPSEDPAFTEVVPLYVPGPSPASAKNALMLDLQRQASARNRTMLYGALGLGAAGLVYLLVSGK